MFPREAADRALENPLLEADTSKVSEALVNIVGSPDLSLEEAEAVAHRISENLSSDASVTWGAQVNENLEKTIKVLIIVPGVESPWARGIGKPEKREEVEKALKDLKKIF